MEGLLETGDPVSLPMQLSEEPMGPTFRVHLPLGSIKAAWHHEQRGKITNCICRYIWGKHNPCPKSCWCEGHVLKDWENGTW